MVPPPDTPERERAQKLLGLERELFRWWCQLTFQPGKGLMDSHEKGLLRTLKQVDEALGETAGPWFLGGEAPSLVDPQYGPGQSVGDAAPYAKVIDGVAGGGAGWYLPLELGPEGRGKVEPLAPLQDL